MISYQNLRDFSMRQLSELEASELQRLQTEANEKYHQAKAAKDWLEVAIAFKYQSRANALRKESGQETGVVCFEDHGIPVYADLPEQPVWDQHTLSEIAQRIRTNGEDPSEFLEITYHVLERDYQTWPDSLREVFASARTVKTGKPMFLFGEVKS